jgi:hypothetical protein
MRPVGITEEILTNEQSVTEFSAENYCYLTYLLDIQYLRSVVFAKYSPDERSKLDEKSKGDEGSKAKDSLR